MTELAIRQDNAPIPASSSATFERLAGWAQAARGAHEMATSLVTTSFVPEAFRNKPHEATAAILAGAEIGLDPMAALRSFDIIQGTAAPRANTLRAVVQAAGHDITLIESTETRAIVEGQRRGASKPQRSVWTIERAAKLGLTGKHNWKAQPQAMLVARATAECARLIASDAILGIPYASEELDDDINLAPATSESKPPRKTAQRALKPVPAPAPEPEFDDEQPEPITSAQQRKLHACLNERGLGEREKGLFAISTILDRDIETTKDLTKQDAMKVIDYLENLPPEVVETTEPTFDDVWPEAAQPADGA